MGERHINTMNETGIKSVLLYLNAMKKDGIIQEYAICGGYAVMLYGLPLLTYDLDVLVALSTEGGPNKIDTALTKIYEYSRKKGFKINDIYIFVNDFPVQFLPSSISPVFDDAVKRSKTVDVDGILANFVSREHLILMLLTSFRQTDKIRISKLLEKANKRYLLSLMKRLDDENKTLFRRYKEILGRTPKG